MIAGIDGCRVATRGGSLAAHWLGSSPLTARQDEMGGMKLVRDKIPEIMRATGQHTVVHTADTAEFQVLLRQKLAEEVDEFLMSQDPEELADILEVLYALADCLGLDAAKLEALRQEKVERRGGFAERVVWHGPRSAVPAPSRSGHPLPGFSRPFWPAGAGRRRAQVAGGAVLSPPR
jgi:predicted house-cleaning noncanonical NTP pyrophosphatase (MazG superfamily)